MRFHSRWHECAITISVLMAAVSPARADWTSNGTPVVSVAGDQSASQAVPDAAGGIIVVWQDWRGTSADIYIQRMDRNGSPLWTPDGVLVCGAVGNQTKPHITGDGAGGAIVSWDDLRGSDSHIYAQRVDADGNPMWTPDGNPVCTAAGYHTGNVITGDGSGGAILAWNFGMLGSTDIYMQRMNADGNGLWAADGIPLSATTDYQYGPRIVSDDAGGAIVAWADRRSGQYQVYAGRMDGNGNALWTPNGVLLSNGYSSAATPAIEMDRDGTGGAVVTWSVNMFAWLQRISANGATQWGTNGISWQSGEAARITGDGDGGAFVAWSAPDLIIQHYGKTGYASWPTPGVFIGGAVGDQYQPRLVTDGAGGVVTVWSDARFGVLPVLYAQRVDIASGVPTWTPDGIPVSLTPAVRTLTTFVQTDDAGLMAVWNDGDVYAQRIHALAGDWGTPDALITAASDVPGDQGGFVQVDWDASDRDVTVPAVVTYYSLWRATDFVPAGSMAENALPPRDAVVSSRGDVTAGFAGRAVYVEESAAGTYYWEWVGNTNASQSPAYSVIAPTRQDAIEGDPALHYFQVLAHTTAPTIFYESAVATGSSTDDIAPAAPVLLSAARDGNDVHLQWSPSGQNEPDFGDYVVYRSGLPGVPVDPANRVSNATGTAFTDTGVPLSALYYVVVSRDVHGNESTPSNEANIVTPTRVGSPALSELQLGPNAPNPFNAVTTFHVGVPRAGSATVDVFDVAGRRVASRHLPALTNGWNVVEFDGRDNAGRPLPGGVYFWRITAGSESQVRKIVLQR